MIWFERRNVLAINSAASLASVPDVVKNTLAFSIGDSDAIFSASSICDSIR
jgi:hypothetical protein